VFVLFCEGTMVTQFVEGWDFVETLGEGAYGEYVSLAFTEHTVQLNLDRSES